MLKRSRAYTSDSFESEHIPKVFILPKTRGMGWGGQIWLALVPTTVEGMTEEHIKGGTDFEGF